MTKKFSTSPVLLTAVNLKIIHIQVSLKVITKSAGKCVRREREKQSRDNKFENSTTVKVNVGDNKFVKTKIVTKFKIIFW